MQLRWLLVAAAAAALLPGCLSETFREGEPRLEFDRVETSVRAKGGDGFVRDTFYVSSNRSWSAAVADGEADWLSVATSGFENPAGVLKTAPLVVVCKDNSSEEERASEVVIFGSGLQKTITVHQRGVRRIDEVEGSGIDPFVYEDYGQIY